MHVTIIGSGNTGHLYAGLFSAIDGTIIKILTRKAEEYNKNAQSEGICVFKPDGSTVFGKPDLVTSSVSAAASDADLIVITVPAHARAQTLKDLKPHLPLHKKVLIGAIPGFGGFNIIANDILGDMDNVVIWGLKDVPYMAYAPLQGISSKMGGPKKELFLATHDKHTNAEKEEVVLAIKKLFPADVSLLQTYLSITLTPGNPIMHPPMLYGLIGPYSEWDGKPFERRPTWWADATQLGTYFIQRCDEEMANIRAACTSQGFDVSDVDRIHPEIVDAYGDQISNPTTLLTTLQTNQAYTDALIPMVKSSDGTGWIPDIHSRVFCEDVPHGLGILIGLGKQFGVETPYMSEIEAWALSMMDLETRTVPPIIDRVAV